MKFIIIIRKTYIPDQYPVAHLWFTILIRKKEQIISSNRELIIRHLSAELTSFLDFEPIAHYIFIPRVPEEGNREAPIRKL